VLGEPEPMRIKGADKPVPARRLLAIGDHAPRRRSESPLVGRQWEGAADNAATQLVRVQPCQLSVSDTKRRHCPDRGTVRVLRGVKGLAAQRLWALRSEQSGGRASVGARR
jgi:hypothetical protein